MKNRILLENIELRYNTITYSYKVFGDIKKYLLIRNKYFITYEENIENIPLSIAVIPFLSNLIPLSWVFDFEIEIPCLDKDYYEQLLEVKKGYQDMYPTIEFKGSLIVEKIEDNKLTGLNNKSAILFSGGVDAYTTVLDNINQHPILINLQGSEIDLNETQVLSAVEKDLRKEAKNLNLDIKFIKTSFRKVINEDVVNFILKKKVNETWWHGFQHGIAIISHAAPLTYLHNISNLYISSSFTRGDIYTCASDPTIDNKIKFAGCNVIHYGYDYTRQDKIERIGLMSKQKGININLRVCFHIDLADNCCHCEKCYRTIFSLISLGYNPNEYGFNAEIDDKFYNTAKYFFDKELLLADRSKKAWILIQEQMRKNGEFDKKMEWFVNYNFNDINKSKMKFVRKYYNAVKKRIIRFIKYKGK